MEPHQERVIAEKAELDARLKKLRAFIASDAFESLPIEEAQRLARQASIMLNYSAVLGERIAAF